MLDHILLSSEPGKWRAFLDALEDAEYPYLARLLQGKDKLKPETFHTKRIMEIFSPYLEQHLNPVDLVPPLYASRVINFDDKDEIMTVYNRLGATSASMCLVDLIQRRLDPEHWYKQFLRILFDVGRSDLATLLEPIYNVDTDLKCPPVPYTSNTDISHCDLPGIDNITTETKQNHAELVNQLRVPKIINFLVPTIISSDERATFLEIDRKDPKESVSKLLTLILEKKCLVAFVEALRAADYPYLVDLLTRDGVYKPNFKQFSVRIDIFRPYICARIDPCALTPHLCSTGVINYIDKEEIHTLKQNEGIISSASHLLKCIQCRQSPKIWFTEFLNSLIYCGQEDLAKLIEPDYMANTGTNSDTWISKLDECLNDERVLHLSHGGEEQLLCRNQNNLTQLHDQLEELSQHENSVLKSECDIQAILKTLHEDISKQKLETEKELEHQVSMIMNEIHKRRCVLKAKIENYHDAAGNSPDNIINAQILANSLQITDQRLATLKFNQSYNRAYGAVSNNVTFQTNAPNGEQSMPLNVTCEIFGAANQSDTSQRDQTAAAALDHPPRGEHNTVAREHIQSEREKRDETDKLSDVSSNPSSAGYMIISQGCLEELEDEQTQDNRLSSLSSNGSFLVSEHRGRCVFSDLKILPNGHYLVADSAHKCLMLFDDTFRFQKEIPLDGYPIHVGALSDDDIAVHVDNGSNITLCKMQSTSKTILEWQCEFNLCALCTKGAMTIYTLCEGKHMHVFRLDAKLCDDFDLGIQKENWWPRFMAVDDKDVTKHIYLTERNTNSIFCFSFKGRNLTLRLQYPFGVRLSLSGIAYCAGRILIADSEGNMLIELDERGTYKTSHYDDAIVRPFALAYFNGNIFITHANTGQAVLNKTIHCFKINETEQYDN